MQRRETWKVVTLGVALTGLGITGVGVAHADGPSTAPEPAAISVEAPAAVDDAVPAMDDSFDDTYWDDSHGDNSWDNSF